MGRVHASQAFRFLLYLYDARNLKKINFNFNNNLNLDLTSWPSTQNFQYLSFLEKYNNSWVSSDVIIFSGGQTLNRDIVMVVN